MASKIKDGPLAAAVLKAVRDWVAEARIDPSEYKDAGMSMNADYVRRKALYEFEVAKQDPAGYWLLAALSELTGRKPVNLLDDLLEWADVPWKEQPDILTWRDTLITYEIINPGDAFESEAAA